MVFKKGFPLLLAACLAMPAWATEGLMLRDDTLRATASASARDLGKAVKGNKVDLLARQGGWTQIRVGGKTGWVRLLSVRGHAPAGSNNVLAGAAELTQQRDPNKVVATAGLRGLNEEDLRKAHYNAEEMQRLEGQAVTGEAARRFAAEGNLVAVKLGYLPAPKPKETTISPTGGFEF
ncbi:MAG: SH3 domain-containing protein [Hydrogenophilaceae bacterium]